MNKIRVLLADDHAIMRIGLSSLLSREKDIAVVGEASDGEQAVKLAKGLQPDVVVMDLMMPKLNGSEATRLITSDDDSSNETVTFPRVLIFTSYGQAIDLAHAVLNGASGVLLKNAPTKELALSIRKVAAGEQVLSKVVMGMVRETSAASELTDRQLEAVSLYYVDQMPMREVARILGGLTLTDSQRANARELIAEKDAIRRAGGN